MTPEELLAAAQQMLDGAPRKVGAHRNIAAAFLVRQAMETAVEAIYRQSRWPEVAAMNDRVQQITLPFVIDPNTARDAVFAWNQLSTICHHHAYEVAPPRPLMVALIDATRRLVG